MVTDFKEILGSLLWHELRHEVQICALNVLCTFLTLFDCAVLTLVEGFYDCLEAGYCATKVVDFQNKNGMGQTTRP